MMKKLVPRRWVWLRVAFVSLRLARRRRRSYSSSFSKAEAEKLKDIPLVPRSYLKTTPTLRERTSRKPKLDLIAGD
ncbi:hypothetical protein B0H15DRAFT_506864 [Mycena belliarum]|uniref:Uncharacterized protein n=1 Tax=Mycena belliarum TaxID=1033014 RepID=A0AAD6XXQ3_9AGAR|nr:hypothetical protein B0H15DRAFT_506864 [Mycena belliae]